MFGRYLERIDSKNISAPAEAVEIESETKSFNSGEYSQDLEYFKPHFIPYSDTLDYETLYPVQEIRINSNTYYYVDTWRLIPETGKARTPKAPPKGWVLKNTNV